MMCDVMPTIAEDNISQRSSQFSGEDANFEQLMVSMLDERDKLMDSLREAQERLNDSELKLNETEKERDSLQRQINANLPQVMCLIILFIVIQKRVQLVGWEEIDRCREREREPDIYVKIHIESYLLPLGEYI